VGPQAWTDGATEPRRGHPQAIAFTLLLVTEAFLLQIPKSVGISPNLTLLLPGAPGLDNTS
jgi:hypothetical protein